MKIRIWLALIIVFGMIACGKDKFETVPQLTLKSIKPKAPEAVDPIKNPNLRINIEYTDKEGDVSDSLLIVRQRLNIKKPVTALNPYDIPSFPTKDRGEFEVTLPYYTHLTVGMDAIPIPGTNPKRNEVDTLRLKIVARDKAGNKSDTLVVDNVYVIR
jgi:hypothetical protein